MGNLWKESYSAADINPPDNIVREQCVLLPKLTGDMVSASIKSMSALARRYQDIDDAFAYDFILKGKFLKDFSYRIMSFFYGISMYPVRITINAEIASELSYDEKEILAANTQEELEMILQRVLASEKVTKVITAIMKMSKSDDDWP